MTTRSKRRKRTAAAHRRRIARRRASWRAWAPWRATLVRVYRERFGYPAADWLDLHFMATPWPAGLNGADGWPCPLCVLHGRPYRMMSSYVRRAMGSPAVAVRCDRCEWRGFPVEVYLGLALTRAPGLTAERDVMLSVLLARLPHPDPVESAHDAVHRPHQPDTLRDPHHLPGACPDGC